MRFEGFDACSLFEGLPGRWLLEPAAGSLRVQRMAPLAGSSPDCVCFFFAKGYAAELPSARPGVLVTGEPFVGPLEKSGLSWLERCRVFVAENPAMAMAVLSERFARALSTVAHLDAPAIGSIHPAAVVSSEAKLGARVRIASGCVIEAGAEVGEGVVLYPNCYVGANARIGSGSVLFPGVVIYEEARIGERVRIHANTVIGADGFGYVQRFEGGRPVEHVKVHHLGRVVIEDDVEIGASCTVDRATIGETRIGRGAKLDDKVHVGHNAQVSEGAILCGAAGLAGRARVGRFAMVGGAAGINNDTDVGDYAMIAAMTPVVADVPAGGKAAGNPQREFNENYRIHAMLNKMLKERERERARRRGESSAGAGAASEGESRE